jgi:uncharacterized delta-60 repeat protein
VYSLAVQADGNIVVGGNFYTLGGQSRSWIGRLNSDGTLDTTFNPGANHRVYTLAVQADGRILVGGSFTTLGGQPRNYIGRLNSNGTLDTTFNPGANSLVFSLAVQADGKILVGGRFTTLGGQSRNRIGRLTSDGTLDTTFINPGAGGGLPPDVNSLAVQADGKILVGGRFTTLGGQPRRFIGRLNNDGTLDTSFNPGANGYVESLAMQADGKILAGGDFTILGGQAREHIGRLNNTEPATQSLSYDGSSLTWLRGGTSPEVWRTTFEVSTNNGADWFRLGEGARISSGWQLTGISVPANANIRARGFATGGQNNGSSWYVESTITVPPPTPAELVEQLIALVNESDLRHKQPLLASLEAALASIQRGNCQSAVGQLHAFQNKVRAQVSDANLALAFVQRAGQVIAALDCDGSPRVAAKIHSVKRHANGRIHFQFSAPAGRVYIVEASTNLVDWASVGVATVCDDGSFEFEDADAARHPCRFYRVVEP